MADDCCRVCLQAIPQQELHVSLFSTIGERVLAVTFAELCGIGIQSDDELPQFVCIACVESIEVAHSVRQKCIESDKVLREIMASMKPIERVKDEHSASVEPAHDPDDDDFGGMEHFSQNLYNAEASSMILEGNREVHAASTANGAQPLEPVEIPIPTGFLDILNSSSNGRTGNEPKSCCGCELSFQTESDLQEHSLAAHYSDRIVCTAKPHECTVCYKRFIDEASLTLHAITRSLCYRCRFCEKRFNDRKQLQFHEKYHRRKYVAKDESCECSSCGRTFRFRSSLRAHARLHTVDTNDDRIFKCSQCERQFMRLAHLRSHEISHSDKTPFGCGLCALKFKRKQHLTAHLKIHQGTADQAYKCRHCGLAFKHQSTRAYHEVSKHTGHYPFSCGICGRNFFRKPLYDKHMARHCKAEREDD
uniref:Protein krueppel n=1 Tax=Anopheles dirus TaxID=7168 RepID=A0A182NEP4_9DIPT